MLSFRAKSGIRTVVVDGLHRNDWAQKRTASPRVNFACELHV
jgi:hypothetical protein